MNRDYLLVDGISKSFRRADGAALPVLEKISFSLGRGEVACLLGPSGCGKTTLLNIVAGLESSDSGRILIMNAESRISRVGYMFQSDGLLAWRTVERNVTLGLEMGWSARSDPDNGQSKGVAKTLLREVGLSDFSKAYPAQLSGGMRQKVALARTLAVRPQLMLLDEPLAHLDILSRIKLGGIIRDYVAREGATAIIVSHSVEDALLIGDRVVVLNSGPARVVTQFEVKNFGGSSRMAENAGVLFEEINAALRGDSDYGSGKDSIRQ